MSSQDPHAWALTTSSLEGAFKTCIKKFEDANSAVEKMLIHKCRAAFSRPALPVPQPPEKNISVLLIPPALKAATMRIGTKIAAATLVIAVLIVVA
jgi:hypothetical protein